MRYKGYEGCLQPSVTRTSMSYHYAIVKVAKANKAYVKAKNHIKEIAAAGGDIDESLVAELKLLKKERKATLKALQSIKQEESGEVDTSIFFSAKKEIRLVSPEMENLETGEKEDIHFAILDGDILPIEKGCLIGVDTDIPTKAQQEKAMEGAMYLALKWLDEYEHGVTTKQVNFELANIIFNLAY